MMAAATPGGAAASPSSVAAVAPQPQAAPPGRDMPSLGSEPAGSEVSEHEYFDARSTVSPSEPAEPLDGEVLVGGAGPKVVETVAKACRRLEGVGAVAAAGESVVERDIRLQREREEQVQREREAALDLLRDDGFVSIPTSTTDEGNFSEYGSEEKENSSLDGSSSRVMSPDVGALPHHHHQRTQSMDSTSSGHSSGSGSGSGSGSSGFNGRRRVTVKPLAEPEDQDTPTFIRPSNETPIEREIRLAREREAELAREKALRLSINSPTATNGPANLQEQPAVNNRNIVNANTPNNAEPVVESRESVRNATNRIQQEISRANEREQELRHSKENPQQRFSMPEFPDRVKLKKSVSTSHLSLIGAEPLATSSPAAPPQPSPTSAARPPLRRLGTTVVSTATLGRATLGRSVSVAPSSPAAAPSLSSLSLGTPRRFAPNPSQKGLMQRFLASRGKMSPGGLVSNGPSSGARDVSPATSPTVTSAATVPPQPHAPVSLSTAVSAKMTAVADSREEVSREPEPAPLRRGYTSAEDKIQEELKEMRRREEELRVQRARTFARSQPNLLSLLDDVDGPDSTTLNESSPVIDKLPAMAVLRSALSNPNLLDDETHHNGVDSFNEKNLQKNIGIRKKSALIAEWENRIQQHIEH
ncbi:hypothetical protein ONE63_005761 [Megalurothrips usitatus]|uniref:A-kinase anchor protein 2 C-terminal domain-containing protein n=1 Tax=Megalurothrips usitatus TaxID=439358 RepID=A0AAV7XWK1_9NEOP|nr:hypothetical protein ONE63_005761 [Megalurothrips usitatus]